MFENWKKKYEELEKELESFKKANPEYVVYDFKDEKPTLAKFKKGNDYGIMGYSAAYVAIPSGKIVHWADIEGDGSFRIYGKRMEEALLFWFENKWLKEGL